jgi:hypothetical protein
MTNKKGNTSKAGRARPAAGTRKGRTAAPSASPLRLIGLALIGVGVIAVVPTVLELLQGGGPEDLTGLLVRLLPGPLLVLGGLALMERARAGAAPSSTIGELGFDAASDGAPMPSQPWSAANDDALANSSAWGFWSNDAEPAPAAGGAASPTWAGSSAASPAAPADLGAAWLGAGPVAASGGAPNWGPSSVPGGFGFDLGGPIPTPAFGGGFGTTSAAPPAGPGGFEAAFAAATVPAVGGASVPFETAPPPFETAAASPFGVAAPPAAPAPFEFGSTPFGGSSAPAPGAPAGFELAFAPVPPPVVPSPFEAALVVPPPAVPSPFEAALVVPPPAVPSPFEAALVVPPPAVPSPFEAALVVPPPVVPSPSVVPAAPAPSMPAPAASAPTAPPVRSPEPPPAGVATLVPNVQIVKAGTRLVLDATDPRVIEQYRNWVLDQATGATAFEPLRVEGHLDQWFLLSACGVATLLSWTHEDHGATYPKEVWVDQILPEQGIAIADRELATELIVAAALHAGGVYTPPSTKLRSYQPAELVTSMAAMHVGLLRLYCALERTDPAKVLRDQLGAPNVDAAAAVGAAPRRLLAPGW